MCGGSSFAKGKPVLTSTGAGVALWNGLVEKKENKKEKLRN